MKPKVRRILAWGAAGVLAANAAVAGILHWVWSGRVEEAQRELEALGFHEPSLSRPGSNAAECYREALSKIEPLRRIYAAGGSERGLHVTVMDPGAAISDELRQGVEALLSEYADAVRLALRAVDRDGCDWGGAETAAEFVADVDLFRRLVEANAVYHADRGRTGEAALSVRALYHLAWALTVRPDGVRALLAELVLRSATRALSYALMLEKSHHRPDFEALGRYLDDAFVSRALEEGLRQDYRILLSPLREESGIFAGPKRTFAVAAKAYAETARALAESYTEAARRAARVEAIRLELGAESAWAKAIPMAASFVDARASSTALVRLARAALLISAHGSLPRSPDAVGIPLGEDPYTGGRLRYRLLPRGAVVYSVGWNLADDGGSGPLWDRRPPDLAFPLK